MKKILSLIPVSYTHLLHVRADIPCGKLQHGAACGGILDD